MFPHTRRSPAWVSLVAALALTAVACTGRNGQAVDTSKHSTYPHHYHDGNGMPHPKVGGPLPPPHNHRHGPTWKN